MILPPPFYYNRNFYPKYNNYYLPASNYNYLENNNSHKNENNAFEIFGISLEFDDLLILGLLFFLYMQDVDDYSLYIVLILLLLN